MEYLIIVIIIISFILYNQFRNTKKIINFDSKNNLSKNEKKISKTIQKIKKEQYNRYILTKNTTENYILKMIKEYGELSGNIQFNIYNFDIAEYGEWIIIRIDENISFYVYHNLVDWLNGYEENPEMPKLSFGFAKNKTYTEKDYLFFLDPKNEYGDTQIGAFRNEKSFSIYLPEAYEIYGNLTINNEIKVSMKNKIKYIYEQGLNISDIDTLKYKEFKIKMNE